MAPKTFYIAGPMTGYDNFNFPAFDKAEMVLRSWGINAVNPAQMDRDAGIDEQQLSIESAKDMARVFAKRDCNAIIDNCSGMYMLKGWEYSVGARAEHALACWLGLEIVYESDLGGSIADG